MKMDLKTSGLDETLAMLEKVTNIEDVQKVAIYKGAGVVADIMRDEVRTLKTSDNYARLKMRYCYPEDKQALLDGLGVAGMKSDGDSVNTKVGFDGYFTGKNGDKIPLPMVANSINAGTSFMYKQPFIQKTMSKANKKAVAEMQDALDEQIDKITK